LSSTFNFKKEKYLEVSNCIIFNFVYNHEELIFCWQNRYLLRFFISSLDHKIKPVSVVFHFMQITLILSNETNWELHIVKFSFVYNLIYVMTCMF
jgi:phenolic acid decarboxylase